MKLLTFVVLLSFPLLAQDNFVRGVFRYWGTNVDYTQMHDSLHINWIQAVGEYPDGTKLNNVLNNSGNLNVMGQMNHVIKPKSSTQRMVFYAEKSKLKLNNYERELYDKAFQGDTVAQKELSKRMLAKTPPNLRRFIIDVNKYPLIRLKKADKGLQILYVRQTQ